MKRRLRSKLTIFLFLTALSARGESFSVEAPLGGIESRYTNALIGLLKSWPLPSKRREPASPQEIQIQCFETPGDEFYIGASQQMIVDAPFERVKQILDDFPGYVGMIDGLVKAKVHDVDSNHFGFLSEQEIPVPFVPNETNDMVYVSQETRGKQKIYRYQLKTSGNMKYNDGVLIIEASGTSKTLYSEFDFWDLKGIVRSFSPGKIWRESLRGIYQSDVAIKLAAEHPDWTKKQVHEESMNRAESHTFENEIKNKTVFEFLRKQSNEL